MTRAPRRGRPAERATIDGEVFALFRVAAGPRLGHGHLRRAEVLAQALGRPACVSIRGAGGATRLPAIEPRAAVATLDAVHPSVVVLDDPAAAHGLAWCRAARRRRVPVVSLHDLGIGRVPSTLAIDGSVVSPSRGWSAATVLRGLGHAAIRPPRPNRRRLDVRRALISFGGGPRRALVAAVASELARRWPTMEILTTQPVPAAGRGVLANVRLVAAPAGLGEWLPQVDVAVLAGGVSLYEAIAAGVPSVAVAIVPQQRPTIRGFAALGLAVDAGRGVGSTSPSLARRVADRLSCVIEDAAWRARVRREGPRAVDGRGAARVARAIVAVAEAGRRD
jgi:UDP:flavonoid glycosyltransferase YjiC (YdhE family)